MAVYGSYAIGRLTADPVLKEINTKDGAIPVCEFSIAVNYGYGDNEKTEFVNCTAWRKLAEIIGNHCKKGRKIYVAGHQQTRNYDVEKEGVTMKQYRTEWVIDEFEFCDSATASEAKETEAPESKPVKKAPF